jgi:hypothetical protein
MLCAKSFVNSGWSAFAPDVAMKTECSQKWTGKGTNEYVGEYKNNDEEDGRDARCKDTKYDDDDDDYTYAHIFYKDVLCSYRNIN